MADVARADSNRNRTAWLAVGAAALVGGIVGVTASARGVALPMGLESPSVLALLMVFSGITTLFPLAAFGPKADRATTARVRIAACSVLSIVAGTAQLIPNSRLSMAIAVVALIFWGAAMLGIPKAWFVPPSS
jgi:hypothetical protein